MSMRFDTMLFPGGLSKAFTLSYDDGVTQDKRLAELFRSHGLKCTFNLNAGMCGHKFSEGVIRMDEKDWDETYVGHELGGHALYHSALDTMGKSRMVYEIIEDKRQLEKHAGEPMRMFAYPFGTFNDEVVDALRMAGYEGARTTVSTHSFALPRDFLRWDPTCHHGDEKLMELAKQFCEGFTMGASLFYVWGHAYEFDGANNWNVIEELCAYIDEHREKLWICTNGEILKYVKAFQSLEYSADGTMIRNPSALDVWFQPTFGKVEHIPAGTVWHGEE